MRDAPDEVTWRRLRALGATGHRESPEFEHNGRAAWIQDGSAIRSSTSLIHHHVNFIVWDRDTSEVFARAACGTRLNHPTAAPGQPCKRCFSC